MVFLQVESDAPAQCPPIKHGPGVPSSVPKQTGSGAVMPSPLYPSARDPLERGMRQLVGNKDVASQQLLSFQHGHRQPKSGPGSKGNNFHMSSSWDWPSSSAHGGRQVVSSSTDIVGGIDDPSGLVMEMQTAFEEGTGSILPLPIASMNLSICFTYAII